MQRNRLEYELGSWISLFVSLTVTLHIQSIKLYSVVIILAVSYRQNLLAFVSTVGHCYIISIVGISNARLNILLVYELVLNLLVTYFLVCSFLPPVQTFIANTRHATAA